MADRIFGITNPGKVRDNNEDVFIAEEIAGQLIIAGVIDGVGGYAGGEVAAALTKETILKELSVKGKDITEQLLLAFNLSNEQIIAEKQGNTEFAEMACVATLAVINQQDNQLHYIHVGDTRLYLFRDNSLIKLSHDQSFVGFLEDSGRITEDAAMSHPKRNQINQALGLESRAGKTDVYFETGFSPFLPGDLCLICSDGLTDLVNKTIISSILTAEGSLQVKAEKLVEAANNAGGKDNITVVLVRNDKPFVQHDMTRPAADHISSVSQLEGSVYTATAANQPLNTLPASANQAVGNGTSINQNRSSADQSAVPASVAQGVPKPDHSLAKSVEVSNDVKSYKPKNNKVLLILLSLICLFFITASVALYNSLIEERADFKRKSAVVIIPLNPQEKMLRDALANLKTDTLILSADQYTHVIHLSQAIPVNRDTLVLRTNAITFQSDSAYKGPAFILSGNSKHITIDQAILENFETGILAPANVVELKNVSFKNIKYPLQLSFEFPDHSYVSGRLTRRVYQADSLMKK